MTFVTSWRLLTLAEGPEALILKKTFWTFSSALLQSIMSGPRTSWTNIGCDLKYIETHCFYVMMGCLPSKCYLQYRQFFYVDHAKTWAVNWGRFHKLVHTCSELRIIYVRHLRTKSRSFGNLVTTNATSPNRSANLFSLCTHCQMLLLIIVSLTP